MSGEVSVELGIWSEAASVAKYVLDSVYGVKLPRRLNKRLKRNTDVWLSTWSERDHTN